MSKLGRQSSRVLPTVHAQAAGLDVGSTFRVVGVPPESCDEPVRTFRSFTSDLHRVADWLRAIGVATIAMVSTGVYWIPVFEILETRSFEVLPVNARDTKNVPGRKTDVNETQGLQQLHQFGLLRGSFRPHEHVVPREAGDGAGRVLSASGSSDREGQGGHCHRSEACSAVLQRSPLRHAVRRPRRQLLRRKVQTARTVQPSPPCASDGILLIEAEATPSREFLRKAAAYFANESPDGTP